MNAFYSGIGSRKIPQDIADLIEELGYRLACRGYILRSGASPGADTAFELGTIRGEGKYEIYLPWEGFGKRSGEGYYNAESLDNYLMAGKIARKYHPDFSSLSDEAKKLIIRDTYQVLGYDLSTPSSFLMCWTPDACISTEQRSKKTGGTGQAISIAADLGISIYNLRIQSHREKVIDWINTCSH
ncbi:MAG: hypothetical protein ACLFUI_07690 [Halanaerobiales bacterium]